MVANLKRVIKADLERVRYCPFCGALLPGIHERSSLADLPYEKCRSCGREFTVKPL